MASSAARHAVQGRALHIPVFRGLWVGDIAARFGHQISLFLLPLIVVVADGTGTQTGLVSAAQFAPTIVLSLVVGVWSSRLSLRRMLAVSNLVRGCAFLSLAALSADGQLQLSILLIVALLVGSVTVFYDIGIQVAVPRVVPSAALVPANGLLQVTASVMQMVGPAAAGFLAATAGVPLATLSLGIILCAAATLFALLRSDELTTRPAGRRPTVWGGLKFTWQCRPVRYLCAQSALFNLHEQAFLTVFLLHGVQTMHLSGGVVGTLIGIGGVGVLGGSLVATRLGRRPHVGWLLSLSIVTASGGLLLVPVFAASGGPTALLAIGFVINGAALATYNIFAITVRQEISPPLLLGAVTASYRLATFGMLPIGALVGGVLADQLRSGGALWTVSLSMVVSSMLLLASPLRRARDVEELRQHAAAATPAEVGDAPR
jgi:MFS family permease